MSAPTFSRTSALLQITKTIGRCGRRQLHASSKLSALVGPPDPISHLRPVIYDEPVHNGRERGMQAVVERTTTSPTHPYSLEEFDGDPSDYQWKLERKRLDAYNHTFWTDSNSRFEAAKSAVLQSLPEDAPLEHREEALSEFYRQWLTQEREHLREYSEEWNRRNFEDIRLAARIAFHRFRSRFFGSVTR